MRLEPGSGRRTAVIIPVKGSDPKRRLSSQFSLAERRQLQIAMLEDTLQTLMKARMIGQTYVVSSNSHVLSFVQRFGANAVLEANDDGVSAAVRRGLEETSSSSSCDRQLVIPADLPLLAVEDLKACPMLAREGAQVVLSPSETFDGTNLLLLTRGARLTLYYDDDSFRKHFASALSHGLRVAVYYSKGVGFDIDRPSDVHRFFKYHRRGSTLTFLARTLHRAERKRQRQA